MLEKPDSGWVARRAEWLIAATVLTGLWALLPVAGAEGILRTVRDDTFYYCQIARNIVSGVGMTFDGIHPTNGFHPLWLVVILPVFRFFSGDEMPLYVVRTIEVALVACAAVKVFRILKIRIGRAAAAFGALWMVAEPGALQSLRGGMEGALLLCLLVVVWQRWLVFKSEPLPRTARAWALGIACALAFFARMEAILVVPAILVVGHRELRRQPLAAVAIAAPTALCAACYSAWSRAVFGIWGPISGMVKSHDASALDVATRWHHFVNTPWFGHYLFSTAMRATDVAGWPLGGRVAYALACALGMAALVRYRRTILQRVRQAEISVVLVACSLMVIADLVVLSEVSVWSNVPLLLASSLLGAALLPQLRSLPAVAAVLAGVGVLSHGPRELQRQRAGAHSPVYDARQTAEWLRLHTKSDDRIGSWSAGALGYFSHRTVINLDGLVNDASYFRVAIVGGDTAGYVRRERIIWLADMVNPYDPDSFFFYKGVPAMALDFDVAARIPDGEQPRAQVWRARR